MTVPHNYDLTGALLGTEVPLNSPVITWKDGHTTILPAVYDDKQKNLCEAVDIPIIQYLAKCPESTPCSQYMTHISNADVPQHILEDVVSSALSQNKPVVIRGIGQHPVEEELTADFLDKQYTISPHRVVWIHDAKSQAIDHMNVTTAGVLKSFCESMKNPDKIQCVLDISLAQTSLPDQLRMEVGMKFWVVFRPIDRHDDRKHLQEIAIKLGDFTENEVWIQANCHAEVITIMPGDTLIIPPGQLHAVYTPVASFATGGHFYHLEYMHLTEISRYLNVVVGDCLTNQGKQYRAKGGHKSAVADTETAALSAQISTAIASHLRVTKRKSASMLLYKGDQFERGELVVREKLDKCIQTTALRLLASAVPSKEMDNEASGVEGEAKWLAAMFLMHAWSFLEMYSKMDLGAGGMGVILYQYTLPKWTMVMPVLPPLSVQVSIVVSSTAFSIKCYAAVMKGICFMITEGSVTPTRAPALPTPAPALLDSPRGGALPAPRKTAVWTAMTPPLA
ncbi:uncharacterized protein F5147DRAFT_660105 [Suillus discolor]|uniref:JmjC domain-containing protein n=1 Tax=Suillus discolor TaxID=1912936 RepID=A0A9P7EQS7_9AGAM|nr:uncharacterized protein F5147DRAFT_660105 [Suillus discolor]KAG2083674.1 hypothetical protein F5147DRAFT_660105 [Suillus discolor]